MAIDRSLSETERNWLRVLSTQNENQARLLVAQRALELGRGGISQVSELTGMSRPTIYRGIEELRTRKKWEPSTAAQRIRQAGGGRKALSESDPEFLRALQEIMEHTTAGDPMSRLKWTNRSTSAIAGELTRNGHPASTMTVWRYMEAMGYSLQGNVKSLSGKQHPNRDAQFRYINKQANAFLRSGDPVISVDAKKKGEPQRVFDHDFPSLGNGHGTPYGAYDNADDGALVNVGISHDTAEFAVASIKRWWRMLGRKRYPKAKRLLICADSGASNGSRSRGWKYHLQELVDEIQIPISVCHYPPGTSKWNKIEHRLFSFIRVDWKGQPLITFETVVTLIAGTTTRSGLEVKAFLDEHVYEKGQKISDGQIEQLNVKKQSIHPDWNYTFSPERDAS